MRVVIFANGDFPDPEAHRHLIQPDDLIIAADGGEAHARTIDLVPDVIVGDLDSLEDRQRDDLEAGGTQLIPYPPKKDETDLELALLHALERGAEEILVLAALGGRLDQTIANLLLLAHPALEGTPVRILQGRQHIFLIRNESVVVEGDPGDTVSLIPLGGDARGVTASGLRWPLQDETLRFGPARGVSNVLLGRETRVRVREGILLCAVTRGGAE